MLSVFSLKINNAHAGVIDVFLENIYSELFSPIASLLFVLATVIFFWGVIEYIAESSNEESVSDGKRHIVWGLVGIVIIISVWGIMNLICSFIGACA
jgi:phosphatidylglycerophosphatase A